MRSSSRQGPSQFATLFAAFEEHLRQTSSVRHVFLLEFYVIVIIIMLLLCIIVGKPVTFARLLARPQAWRRKGAGHSFGPVCDGKGLYPM